jgi:release factor glutamine methyltransferase
VTEFGAPTTLGAALAEAARALQATSSSPRLDAELLLVHASGATRAEVLAYPDRSLPEAARSALAGFIERRRNGEPIAYLVGTREFWSLPLKVTPAVLIPRPETEFLVEHALHHIPQDAAWTVADIGTGSGAVALAIAHERPRCRVIATDASLDALEVARQNARSLKITNVEFRSGEWLAPLADARFEIIVSNPPYVRADDPHLQEGDVRFEPRAALVAGADGLDAIRHISAAAPAFLRAGGWLLLEHGYDQGDAARDLLARHGYLHVTSHPDLAGRERITEGRAR